MKPRREFDSIYVVVKEGIYRHNIVAACHVFKNARDIAVDALLDERDNYHRFIVLACSIEERTDDGRVVFRVRKDEPAHYENPEGWRKEPAYSFEPDGPVVYVENLAEE